MHPLVLVGLGVGVGEGLGLGVGIRISGSNFNEGVYNLAGVQNSAQHRSKPVHQIELNRLKRFASQLFSL